MLILFDFENIQNFHYKKVKAFLIKEFGKEEWQNAKKIGAVCSQNVDVCLPDWNTSMMIYQVQKKPQLVRSRFLLDRVMMSNQYDPHYDLY